MLCAVEAGVLRCRWSDGAVRVRIGNSYKVSLSRDGATWRVFAVVDREKCQSCGKKIKCFFHNDID